MSNKERPIIFSAPMVRALLAGEKTQTRRVVKPQPDFDQQLHTVVGSSGFVYVMDNAPMLTYPEVRRVRWDCQYGQPGDRLWVRENFCPIYPQCQQYNGGMPIDYDYQATYQHGNRLGDLIGLKKKWKPSVHMTRHASRITLEITAVRVERLQDISESDCWAEGIEEVMYDFDDAVQIDMANRLGCCIDDVKQLYALWWDREHGKGSLDANPLVWIVEHKRIAQEGGAA